ncbi:protein adenylyltransferase SelO [Frateuria aurantia]
MSLLAFDNRWLRELPGDLSDNPAPHEVNAALYSRVVPTSVGNPRWLAGSAEAAALLGLELSQLRSPAWLQVLAGNALHPGMDPWASNYGGHQFGHWAGQLGDGRAISLGEALGPDGRRWELQLKGAGPTPYSRTADGRAVLRSSIREFICSEAMHHLGVPTTRALSLVGSSDSAWRDMFYDGRPQREPLAIVCRMAPSFVRFGHFELPASRGDTALVKQLADFVIARDFPELNAPGEAGYAAWFEAICRRTAVMVMHWQRVGFVHGVMNTDNMSILGLSLDYGPYGWLEPYDPRWTPNTTDAGQRRYRYEQQPAVAYWNLGRLAGALASLFADMAPLQAGMDAYVDEWRRLDQANQQAKLGLEQWRSDDPELWSGLLQLMEAAHLDMTLLFRRLSDYDAGIDTADHFADAFYPEAPTDGRDRLALWLERYRQRLTAEDRPQAMRWQAMQRSNPCYVPRNYLVQQVIEQAEAGDPSGIEDLLQVLRQPYVEQPGRGQWASRRPDWAASREGCGMLSCSS